MKLNVDCVRDVLLCVEDNTGLRKSCYFVDYDIDHLYPGSTDVPAYQKKLEAKYHNDELIYHVNYCVEARLLKRVVQGSDRIVTISDLTPSGHQFIISLKNDNIWNKVKHLAQKYSGLSLETITQLTATEAFNALVSAVQATL